MQARRSECARPTGRARKLTRDQRRAVKSSAAFVGTREAAGRCGDGEVADQAIVDAPHVGHGSRCVLQFLNRERQRQGDLCLLFRFQRHEAIDLARRDVAGINEQRVGEAAGVEAVAVWVIDIEDDVERAAFHADAFHADVFEFDDGVGEGGAAEGGAGGGRDEQGYGRDPFDRCWAEDV